MVLTPQICFGVSHYTNSKTFAIHCANTTQALNWKLIQATALLNTENRGWCFHELPLQIDFCETPIYPIFRFICALRALKIIHEHGGFYRLQDGVQCSGNFVKLHFNFFASRSNESRKSGALVY